MAAANSRLSANVNSGQQPGNANMSSQRNASGKFQPNMAAANSRLSENVKAQANISGWIQPGGGTATNRLSGFLTALFKPNLGLPTLPSHTIDVAGLLSVDCW